MMRAPFVTPELLLIEDALREYAGEPLVERAAWWSVLGRFFKRVKV